jgi:hypothetical protein
MVALLSPAWLERRAELGADLPARPGASARVRHLVSGGPDGDVAFVEVYEDGRLTAVAPASTSADDDDADVTLTMSHADAVAVATGELDLHVGYMRGRIKLLGDIGALMDVLPVTQSDELRAALRTLAAETDLPS